MSRKKKTSTGEVSLDWMPFYIENFLGGTGHMTATEIGGYLLLLIEQWKKGYVPSDKLKLKRIAKVTFKQLEIIIEKFTEHGEGKLINQFCHEVRNEQLIKYKERVKQGTGAANKRWEKHTDGIPSAYEKDKPPHTEYKKEEYKKEDKTNVLITHRTEAIYDLNYFEGIGYDWGIEEPLRTALDNFLKYRETGHIEKRAITAPESVEAILKNFTDRGISAEDAATLIQLTISSGWKNIQLENWQAKVSAGKNGRNGYESKNKNSIENFEEDYKNG